jgi:hypothetical protein
LAPFICTPINTPTKNMVLNLPSQKNQLIPTCCVNLPWLIWCYCVWISLLCDFFGWRRTLEQCVFFQCKMWFCKI